MIEINNRKLHDLIVDKDELVTKGRSISRDIEMLDIKIKRYEDKEKRITEKVQAPEGLKNRGDEIMKLFNSLDKEFTDITKQIKELKLAMIPSDIKEEHEKLMKDREILERDRNKIALKVQKIKDKVIPIIQKEVKPLLVDKYDDIETAKAVDGKIVISTFNHLEEWKKKFR